jgi:hypothetical protein
MRALLSASEHSAEIADGTLFNLSEFQRFRTGPGELHLTFARHRFSTRRSSRLPRDFAAIHRLTRNLVPRNVKVFLDVTPPRACDPA